MECPKALLRLGEKSAARSRFNMRQLGNMHILHVNPGLPALTPAQATTM
jgi:hypothetical protein